MNMHLAARLCRFALPIALALLPLRSTAQFVIPGPKLRANGAVTATTSDAAGNLYLGGSFNDYNGITDRGMGLLRLSSSGTPHPTWDIGFISGVNDVLVAGNFLYVGGGFSSVRTLSSGTLSRQNLLRIHLNGASEGRVDTTWAPQVNGTVNVLETDGTSLFIAGSFTTVNGTARRRLAKITIAGANAGTVDSLWNPSPNNPVADLEYAGSHLYVSGGFSQIGGISQNYLARLVTGAIGAADTAWKPEINRPVGELEASGTHLYFGGDFNRVEGINHRSVGRFSLGTNPPGFDAAWKPDPDGEVSSITISGGSVFFGGVFTTVGGTARRYLAKAPAFGNGGLDAIFAPEPNGAILDMTTVSGQLVVTGRFNTTVGTASAGFAQMNATTGSAGGAFTGNITTDGVVSCMIPAGGGSMYVGGLFDKVDGVARTSLARIRPDGSLDTSFNVPIVGFNRLVSDMKVDGSRLYLCGDFIRVGGAPTQHVARVNPTNGAVDAGWFTKPLTPIRCLETDGNYVYIGSEGLRFIEVAPNSSLPVYNLARLSKGATATVDTAWTPVVVDELSNPATASVNDLLISGNQLIIGGHFAFIVDPLNTGSATTRVGVAALSTSGWGQPVAGWATTFVDGATDTPGIVTELHLHGGSLYVGGDFDEVNGNPWIGVAKLNASNGAWDRAFDVSPIVTVGANSFPGSVYALASSGNQLIVAGDFDYVYDNAADDYTYSPYLVRVNPLTGVPDFSWYPYPDGPVGTVAESGENLWLHGSLALVAGTPVDGMAIVTPFSTAYRNWLAAHLTPAQLANSDFTTPWIDLDGDGDTNLVEAYFDTDPLDPRKVYHTPGSGTSGLPVVRLESSGGQTYLTAEFTRWKSSANSGVESAVKFGNDLTGWPRTGVAVGSPVSISDDRERVKFRDPSTGAARAFGRVEVTPRAQ